MPVSQNGYSANDRSVIASYSIPGGTIALRKGDVSVVLLWCINQWHNTVEPLKWPGNWGYAERTIRGSDTVLSNHASGTASDQDAPAHPLGTEPTANFTAKQIAAIHSIVAYCEGVVRWGGDYTGRKDGMHLEINAPPAEVARIANKIRGVAPAPTAGDDDLTPDEHNMLVNIANQIGLTWSTWAGGTDEKLTLVDLARRQNVEQRQVFPNLAGLHAKVDALTAKVNAAPAGTTSVTASDVVDEIVRRLKGA